VPLPVRPLPARDGDRGKAQTRFGVPPEVPVVLFLGRIDYKKRLPLLVEAVSLLEHQDAHLLVVGDGPDSEKRFLQEAAQRNAVADRVHVTGWVEGSDRAAAFDAADVFALLSDAENFGLSVIEALSVGCPAVISDQLALAGDLASAGAAVVVERKASHAAQAIDNLLTDTAAAAAMGERAKLFVAHEFSPQAVALRLRHLGATATVR